MSQSPASTGELKDARQPDSTYRRNLGHLNELIKRGASFSGHERNCAFLNLRGASFATISAVSGIDFPDDGRGLATVDWDADGDIDVWLTNRTAPRLRFLQNQLPGNRSYLLLKLAGTTCNRDAIGSRVTVQLEHSDQPLIKTLRAGEGYLSQSSKWLHFGLGAANASIESVSVSWPGGTTEVFSDLKPNQRYLIKQGALKSRPLSARTESLALKRSAPPATTPTHVARVPLTSRIPAPKLPFRSMEDAKPGDALEFSAGRPVLIVLWASWCGQCREELANLARNAQQINQAGLNVLALNVDQVIGNPSSKSTESSGLLQTLNWPENTTCSSGQATAELIRRLRSLHDLPFGRQVTMPVPISFLIDADGELAVIYRGRNSVAQLLADVGDLNVALTDWQALALPLRGRWNVEPRRTDLLKIPRLLLENEHTEDALDYVERCEGRLADNHEFPKLRAWLGDQLLMKKRAAEGRAQYEAAVKASPDDITLMNNLAWLLATHPDAKIRDGELAAGWAERAARATQYQVPGVLDTLAASYAESGAFDKALRTVALATQLAQDAQDTEFVKKMKSRTAGYKRGQPLRDGVAD